MFYRLFALLLQQAQVVWRTVVKTGTGLIVANDTTENQPVKIQMQGWTEQNQYEGKNLFDIESAKNPENYVEGAYGYWGLEITAQIGKTYTFNRNLANGYGLGLGSAGLKQDNNDSVKSWLVGDTNELLNHSTISITATQDKIYFVTDQRDSELLKQLIETCFESPMFNEGSTALPYEPYTGSQPSPSPEYPQEIVNAGRYNSETQKYEVEVKLTGKNLLDITKLQTNMPNVEIDREKNEIRLPKGGAIYFNKLKEICPDLKVGDEVYIFADTTSESKNAYLYPSGIYVPFGRSAVIKSLDDQLLLYSSAANPDGAIISNLMITKINDSKFESCKPSQTVIITSDRPITKWDRLVEKEGVIGWEYSSEKFEIDIYKGAWLSSDVYKGFLVNNYFQEQNEVKECFCKFLKGETNANVNIALSNSVLIGLNKRIYFINSDFYNDELPDYGISDMKNFILENKVEILTYSDTSEFVPLPTEEQEALKALKTYYPTTVFSNDGEMFMQVEYQTKVPEQEV